MLQTQRLILRKWTETDADSLYEYAKDLAVGSIAGRSPHKSRTESLDVIRNVFCGAVLGAIYEKNIISNSNQSELYFEEPDIERFAERLEMLYPETAYVNRPMTHSWGQKVIRFDNPDGNLIEVGTPV